MTRSKTFHVRRTARRWHRLLRPVPMAALLASGAAGAVQFDTGDPDLSVRWDNTVKYSAARRLKSANPLLAGDANQGDGDTNFHQRGLISSREDLLSELEASYKGFGLRISAAAWNDAVYLRRNRNDTANAYGPGTSAVNSSQIASANQFTPYARDTHGRNAELLDAFVSGKFDLGGHATTLRLGQHTVQWGESLFFGDNAIAGAMAPVDVAKALSVPNLRFQELLRPVPQASGQIQLSPDVTAYGFYQFRYKENRLQSSGSYFSPVDFGAGGNLILTPTGALPRTPTQGVENGGHGGLALRIRGQENDYGLYLVRFHDKTPHTVTNITNGTYYDYVHKGITALGASIARSVGDFNLAAEASLRNNQDLLSPNAYDAGTGPNYAVGRTAHLNLSAFGTNLGRSALWNDASLLAEVAYSRVLKITRGADTMSGCQPASFPGSVCQPNGTRDTLRAQVLFEPVYYQVVPGLDLRVPIGLSYTFKGSRNMIGAAPLPENGGSFNVGLAATYLDGWRVGLNYTHFFGKAGVVFSPISAGGTQAFNYQQYFRDRDYVSLVASRSF